MYNVCKYKYIPFIKENRIERDSTMWERKEKAHYKSIAIS